VVAAVVDVLSLHLHPTGLHAFTPYRLTRIGEAGAPAAAAQFTRHVALDGDHVVYVDGVEGVRRAPINGDERGELIYVGPVTAVAVDERAFYIAHRGGALRRLAR
jgi:hypothetical protein